MSANQLLYGDNLDILRRHVSDETVDLVYLDPPFKSNQDYNVLFAERDGTRAAARIKAFEDTWRWDQAASLAYQEAVESGGSVADALRAFRMCVGENDMLAYLSMMAPRLAELRRVLKATGSLYLHCDPAAGASEAGEGGAWAPATHEEKGWLRPGRAAVGVVRKKQDEGGASDREGESPVRPVDDQQAVLKQIASYQRDQSLRAQIGSHCRPSFDLQEAGDSDLARVDWHDLVLMGSGRHRPASDDG